MSIFFKPRKSNLSNASGEILYYPQLVCQGKVDIHDIASEIEQISALSKGDVLSVLTNLASVMRRAFQDGRSVQIQGLGTFSFTAKCVGKGVRCAEDVHAQQIKQVHVCFREEQKRVGGKTVRMLTDGVRFVKVGRG